jgi:pimeloyl-ACP methyl ester carboxylesterase
MSRQRVVEDGGGRTAADELRRRLVAGAPIADRRLQLAGVSTAVLEGGEGPPVVLLHGQGGWAGMWLPVIAGLAMLRQVSVDPERARRRMGERWIPFQAYSLELARDPDVRRANRHLLRELGLRQIPPEELARIDVPTSLIWGRQDRVMPLATAQEASARYGWPLEVIDDAGHFIAVDQPEAFERALAGALHRSQT